MVETLPISCTQHTSSGQVLSMHTPCMVATSVLSTLLVSFECEVMQKL